MKKINRKTKIVVAFIMVIIAVPILSLVWVRQSDRCRDIIGDGYAMGTDPEPVVIGNTCDL